MIRGLRPRSGRLQASCALRIRAADPELAPNEGARVIRALRPRSRHPAGGRALRIRGADPGACADKLGPSRRGSTRAVRLIEPGCSSGHERPATRVSPAHRSGTSASLRRAMRTAPRAARRDPQQPGVVPDEHRFTGLVRQRTHTFEQDAGRRVVERGLDEHARRAERRQHSLERVARTHGGRAENEVGPHVVSVQPAAHALGRPHTPRAQWSRVVGERRFGPARFRVPQQVQAPHGLGHRGGGSGTSGAASATMGARSGVVASFRAEAGRCITPAHRIYAICAHFVVGVLADGIDLT